MLGTDAELSINGSSTRSSSNHLKNALPGLDVDLAGLGTTTVMVSAPEPASAALVDAAGDFVAACNGVVDVLEPS